MFIIFISVIEYTSEETELEKHFHFFANQTFPLEKWISHVRVESSKLFSIAASSLYPFGSINLFLLFIASYILYFESVRRFTIASAEYILQKLIQRYRRYYYRRFREGGRLQGSL